MDCIASVAYLVLLILMALYLSGKMEVLIDEVWMVLCVPEEKVLALDFDLVSFLFFHFFMHLSILCTPSR